MTTFIELKAGAAMVRKLIRKIERKHIAAIALLGFAALGASHVPGRHPVLINIDHHLDAAVANSGSASVFGPNNLLGGMTHADVDLNSRTSELSDEHLVSGMSIGQGGDDASLLERLHSVTGNSDSSTGVSVAGSLGVSAVPEPATAGVLAAMLLPTMIRRRRSGAIA